jgi:hypothetical protein
MSTPSGSLIATGGRPFIKRAKGFTHLGDACAESEPFFQSGARISLACVAAATQRSQR